MVKLGTRGLVKDVYVGDGKRLTKILLKSEEQKVLTSLEEPLVKVVSLGSSDVVVLEHSLGIIKNKELERIHTLTEGRYVHTFQTINSEFRVVYEKGDQFCTQTLLEREQACGRCGGGLL